MAALHQGAGEPSIVDLRRVGVWELDPLLLAETVEWRQKLDWDYGRSAELVRRYTSTGSLAGAALVEGRTLAGYGYTVVEEHKGLIGGLYVQPHLRGTASELRLFMALLAEVANTPGVRRVESQLMLTEPATARAAQREGGFRLYERMLMSAPMAALQRLPRPATRGFRFESWGDHWVDSAASVIVLGYRDHVDADVNDQYRVFGAAARFLRNLVDFPGCGDFHAPSSLLAFNRATGRPAGIALCSFVAPRVGHVTQLCVTPETRSQGLGYALLRAAADRLAAAGADRLGLSVTLSNLPALELYRRCGFAEIRRFFAYTKDI